MTTVAPEKTKPATEHALHDRPDYTAYMEGYAWEGKNLRVGRPEAIDKIRRKNFSASAKGDMSTCPAMFAIKSMLPRVMGPLEPAPLGNVAHEGLEHFYDLPADKREREVLLSLTEEAARNHLAGFEGAPEHGELYRQVWGQVSEWVLGIYTLENPKEVDVYATELNLKGHLSNGVPFTGYLDRTDRAVPGDDTSLVIKDYKGLALDTPIPTPTGWTTVAELHLGDEVLAPSGRAARVTLKSEVHNRPCFKLTFSDGSTVVSDDVHDWVVYAVPFVDCVDRKTDGSEVCSDDCWACCIPVGEYGTERLLQLEAAEVARMHADGYRFAIPATEPFPGRCEPTSDIRITDIREVPSVPTQCIKVDDPTEMFLCGTGFVPTHNTGKKVKRPSQRFGDDYGDQMRLYKDAMEQTKGVSPESATLLWPRQGKTVEADLSPAAVQATLNDFKREFDLMNAYSDRGTFPTNPGNLCAWCPAANSCPVANIKSENAKSNAPKMPGGSDPAAPLALGIPTVRPGASTPRISEVKETTMTENIAGIEPVAFPNNKWAAMASVRIADAAAVHLAIHEQPLTRSVISALARVLASLVETTHRQAFLGGFDWSFDSASRAAGVIESTIKGNPAPFGQDRAAWDSWRNEVVRLSVLKLNAGIGILEEKDAEGALVYLTAQTLAPVA